MCPRIPDTIYSSNNFWLYSCRKNLNHFHNCIWYDFNRCNAKITDIITNDGRLRNKQIANLVGFSSGTVFTVFDILKKPFGLQKVSAKCIPHLWT